MLQERLDAARAILESHNSSIGSEEGKIDTNTFFTKLFKMGGTSIAALAAATWEDLEDCGLPRILARSVAQIFRGPEKTESQKIVVDVTGDPEKPIIWYHAATLNAVQIVEYFNPENYTNPYGKKLKEDTENRRCLAFNKDGSLNKDISKQLINEIVNLQYPERTEVIIEGIPSPTYRVGDRPDRFASENPAKPGTPLRPDGASDAGCEWEKVPINIRQLIYIAIRNGEINQDEQDIFDRVISKNFEDIAKRYRKSAVEFGELEKLGTLPQLKIRLGRRNSGKQDPFNRGNRVW